MFDLLDEAEADYAARNGWQLCTVYDAGTKRWALEILPTANNPIKSAWATTQQVSNRARQNDAIAIRSLSLVMRSIQMGAAAPQKKGKKK